MTNKQGLQNLLPCVAVDIGTTTVVLHLIDKSSGNKLASVSRLNEQIRYGSDVTSRIEFSISHGHEQLTVLIREQISSMLLEACSFAGVNSSDISLLSFAGNTVMQYLVANISPAGFGSYPFETTTLFDDNIPPWESLNVSPEAEIYLPPAISAFVGGDITSGLLAAGFEDIDYPSLFIDIGTNGEIVLKHNNMYYCCATAAGPAFEGAEIEMGMVAGNGAINHVRLTNVPSLMLVGEQPLNFGEESIRICSSGQETPIEYYGIRLDVIGGGLPKGFCGSGLIDLLAVLLDLGVVDDTGCLLGGDRFYIYPQVGVESEYLGCLKRLPTTTGSDEPVVYVSASDIRKLQLVKAAIHGGIDVLLHYAGLKESDIKFLAIAGGFGSFMDINSAARIGLFSNIFLPSAKSVGNTSGDGACLVLTQENAKTELKNIQSKCEYIDLSANAFFSDRFVKRMGFQDKEQSHYPHP